MGSLVVMGSLSWAGPFFFCFVFSLLESRETPQQSAMAPTTTSKTRAPRRVPAWLRCWCPEPPLSEERAMLEIALLREELRAVERAWSECSTRAPEVVQRDIPRPISPSGRAAKSAPPLPSSRLAPVSASTRRLAEAVRRSEAAVNDAAPAAESRLRSKEAEPRLRSKEAEESCADDGPRTPANPFQSRLKIHRSPLGAVPS